MKFADRLQAASEKHGVQRIARALRVSPTTINNYLRNRTRASGTFQVGATAVFSLDELSRLCAEACADDIGTAMRTVKVKQVLKDFLQIPSL